jgi:hypothetical protein
MEIVSSAICLFAGYVPAINACSTSNTSVHELFHESGMWNSATSLPELLGAGQRLDQRHISLYRACGRAG